MKKILCIISILFLITTVSFASTVVFVEGGMSPTLAKVKTTFGNSLTGSYKLKNMEYTYGGGALFNLTKVDQLGFELNVNTTTNLKDSNYSKLYNSMPLYVYYQYKMWTDTYYRPFVYTKIGYDFITKSYSNSKFHGGLTFGGGLGLNFSSWFTKIGFTFYSVNGTVGNSSGNITSQTFNWIIGKYFNI